MSGFINLYTSRRKYKIKCSWYKVKKDKEKLIYNEQPSGYFYAKWESPNTHNKDLIGGFLQINNEQITISTVDDTSDLNANDKVVMYGESWLVKSIQRVMIKKQSEFSVKPAMISYISLLK